MAGRRSLFQLIPECYNRDEAGEVLGCEWAGGWGYTGQAAGAKALSQDCVAHTRNPQAR